MPQLSSAASRIGAFVLAALTSSILFLSFCDLVYACGCEALWRGAAEDCNIHNAAGPHCPWCSFGILGGGFIWGSIVASQAGLANWSP